MRGPGGKQTHQQDEPSASCALSHLTPGYRWVNLFIKTKWILCTATFIVYLRQIPLCRHTYSYPVIEGPFAGWWTSCCVWVWLHHLLTCSHSARFPSCSGQSVRQLRQLPPCPALGSRPRNPSRNNVHYQMAVRSSVSRLGITMYSVASIMCSLGLQCL